MKDRTIGITSTTLRSIALGSMFLDHFAKAYQLPSNTYLWMYVVGRIAFVIFAFQLVEGFYHTSDLKKYQRRLLIMALISELPFDYAGEGQWFYWYHQNVMFTLWLGLYMLDGLNKIDVNKGSRLNKGLQKLGLIVGYACVSTMTMVDYYGLGMLVIAIFYFARKYTSKIHMVSFAFVWLTILFMFMFPLGQTLFVIPIVSWKVPLQWMCVLGLVPIAMYNGKLGRNSRFLRLFSYWFYPVHLLVLGILVHA